MSAICQALSLMKVKHDKYKTAAIEEHRELLRLAEIGRDAEKEVLKTEYRLLEKYINMMPKTYRQRNRNWPIVQEFLQYHTAFAGSTSSIEKCIELGIDPDGYEIKTYSEYKKSVGVMK